MDYLSDLASRKPFGWNLVRNKAIFSERKEENTSYGEEDLLSVSEYYGVKPRKAKISDGEILNRADSLEKYRVCHPNDLVMNIMLAWKGSMGVSQYEGIVSPAYSVFAVNADNVSPRFFEYLFQTSLYTSVFKRYSTGIIDSRLRLYPDVFLGLYSLIPSKQEQTRIIEFLDQKCSQIDSLIAVEEEQIEKLNAYRLSLITETVSNGLSDRAFVASGVDWIKTIPAGWRIQKVLSQLAMPITDGPHTTPELLPEGVAFVSAEAVSCGNGRIDFDHIRGFISEEFYQECCLKYVPKINDVYMIKSGATTGRVSIVDSLEPKFTIWSPLAVMRCDENKMFPKFLFYAVQSIHFQRQIALGWSFGTQQNLGMRTLEQLKLIVPPYDEQKEIVEYLDGKLAAIASLIDVKRNKIEKLGEYRKSLIYECVTGKKEVSA